MAAILVIGSLFIAFILWQLFSLLQNYHAAMKIGFPILIGPIDMFHPVWALGESYMLPILKCLPCGLSNFLVYTTQAWPFIDRYRLHHRHGPAFTLVSPSKIIVVIGDPEAAEDNFRRPRDFLKPPSLYGPLEMFGPNLDTVNGEAWQRHRRITTLPFNEKNSGLVWRESLEQAGAMLKSWISKAEQGVTSTNDDIMTMALHVLYMTEMVNEERASSGLDKDNLMSVLVRAANAKACDGKGRNAFTDQEIFGNLFIYNFAGHDTTASTLAYAITLLAMEPRWQAWVREEIQSVVGSLKKESDYEENFPQLKRCLAVMFETLRLYGPVILIPKQALAPQHLTIASVSHFIPANAFICINIQTLHTNPAFWGPDSLTWRPDRWLSHTEFLSPIPGSFIAWASGPRVCPGKKFAQVEFVAVLSKLLGKYEVGAVSLDGEEEEEQTARIKGILEDSEVKVTLKMKHLERISFKWEEVV